MSAAFDPYHKWLGIRPAERPFSHYRLLGLVEFEDDADVISDAADRQMAHVRNYQTGKHSDFSQKILNELSAAKVVLLNPQKKALYDQSLRAAAAPAVPVVRPAEVAVVQQPAAPVVPAAVQPAAYVAQPVAHVAQPLAPVVQPVAQPGATHASPVQAAQLQAAQPQATPRSGPLLPLPMMLGAVGAVLIVVIGLTAAFWPASTPPVAIEQPPNIPEPPGKFIDPPPKEPPPADPAPPKRGGPSLLALYPALASTPPAEAPERWLNAGAGLLRSLPHPEGVRIREVSLTPNGKRGATVGSDERVRIWDIETGALLHELRQPFPPRRVTSVALAASGERAAAAFVETTEHQRPGHPVGEVCVWDLMPRATPQYPQVRRSMLTHTTAFGKVAFSRDGRFLLAPTLDGAVNLVDSEHGETPRKLNLGSHPLRCGFLPGARVLAGGPAWAAPDAKPRLEIWNLERGEREAAFAASAARTISASAASLDGKLLLAGSADGSIHLWDAADPEKAWSHQAFDQTVHSVALANDGLWLIAASKAGLRVFDREGQLVCQTQHLGCDSLATADDPRIVFSGGIDGVARVWRLPDKLTGEVLQAHTQGLDRDTATASTDEPEPVTPKSPPPDSFLSAEPGMLCELQHPWNLATEEYFVAISADARWALTAMPSDSRVVIWNLVTGKLHQSIHVDKGMASVSMSADANRAVVTCRESAEVLDLVANTKARTLGVTQKRALRHAAMSPNGAEVLTCGALSVRLWGADTSVELKTLDHPDQLSTCAAFLSVNRAVLGVSDIIGNGGVLKVWDLQKGVELFSLAGHTAPINSVSASADGRFVVTASLDKTMRAWDLEKKAELWRFEDKVGPVRAAAISGDGQRILAAGSDGYVRLFDIQGRERNQFPHKNCSHLAFAEDNRIVLSGGAGGVARLWRLPNVLTGEVLSAEITLGKKPADPIPADPTLNPAPLNPEPPKADPIERVAVPANGPAIVTARGVIKEKFALDYRARNAEGHLGRSRLLLDESRHTKDGPAMRHTLLTEALEAANEAGEAVQAFEVIKTLDEYFVDVDVVALQNQALREAARAPGTAIKTLKTIARMYRTVIASAIARDQFDEAVTAATAGVATARKALDNNLAEELLDKGREAREKRADYAVVKAAREKLAANPDDAESLALVGKYLCLSKEHWDAGLALWDKAGDANLTAIAARERKRPDTPDSMAELGDLWWGAAEKDTTNLKSKLQVRAAAWYRNAILLGKAPSPEMQKRVAEAPRPLPGHELPSSGATQSGVAVAPTEIPPKPLPQPQPPQPQPPAVVNAASRTFNPQRERAAAMLALDNKGELLLWGQANPTRNVAELPKEFKVRSIKIYEPISPGHLNLFSGLVQLETLHLVLEVNRHNVFAGLQDVPLLKELSIRYGRQQYQLGDVAFAELAGRFPVLERLAIEGDVRGEALRGLATPTLSGVYVSSPKLTEDVFAALALMPSLERVTIDARDVTGEGLTRLRGLKVAYLSLTSPALSDAGLTALHLLPLEELSLKASDITDRGLLSIGILPSLRKFSLEAHLAPITEAGLEALKGFPKLTDLKLHSLERITGAGLSHLSPKAPVRNVHIAECPNFSAAGLAQVTRYGTLANLQLRRTALRDKDMTSLEPLELRTLVLTDTPLTDLTLESIQKIKPLMRFEAAKCQFTSVGLNRLKAQLPNLSMGPPAVDP